jgi:hypothetical protein
MATFVPGGTVGTVMPTAPALTQGVTGVSLMSQIRAGRLGAAGLASGGNELLAAGGQARSYRSGYGYGGVAPLPDKTYGAMPAGLRQGGVAEGAQIGQAQQPDADWLRQNWAQVQKQYNDALNQNLLHPDLDALLKIQARREELEKATGMKI